MKTNKVVWSEGLFLRPQIFQQQERYLEYFIHRRSGSSGIFFWGFSRCETDHEALKYGKLVMRSAVGVFPDGTPFDLPGHAELPVPVTLQPSDAGKVFWLAVPLRLDNCDETIFNPDEPGSLARFCAMEEDICDSNAIRQGVKPVQLGRLRLALRSETEMNESWIGLPVARVRTIRPDGSVELHDDDYLPPVTQLGTSALLTDWLNHLSGLLKIRAEMLASYLSSGQGGTVAGGDLTDYLLLQIFNNYQVQLDCLKQIPESSPLRFYQTLASLAAELSTYIRVDSRRPSPLPGYQHSQLYLSLRPLVDEVHDLLNQVLVRAGEMIELQPQGNGLWTAKLLPAEFAAFSAVVLAVQAGMAPDILQQQFVSQSKISSPQQLPELVRSHLSGLLLLPLRQPPRQIPCQAGYVYFELLRDSDIWRSIAASGALALHVAGHFPGLSMELWGIRAS